MGCMSFTLSYIFFSVVHIVGFALALTVCGLYGKDLSRANEQDKYADSKWVYAVVVGGISAVTCVLYLVPFILRIAGVFAPVWDFILFILWIAVFGVFGRMYINEDAEGDGNIERMKNAVWVDLANALLWLLASLGAFLYWWKHRDTRSQFTGRAHV
jgi:H+/Cl- antiporter ClcA